jgi:S1-C subfamily serine protease
MEFEPRLLDLQRGTVDVILMLVNDLCFPEYRETIISGFASSGSLMDKSETKQNRLKMGWLSEFDFIQLLAKYANEKGKSIRNNAQIVGAVFGKLRKYGIITDVGIPGVSEFKVTDGLMAYFRALGLVENMVFGLGHMIESAKRSVPAVNVKLPNGDIHCGSGIVIKCGDKPDLGFYVLTNRHVVDGNTIQDIQTPEQLFDVIGEPTLCEHADLAAIPVARSIPVPIIAMLDEVEILMPVIALGYPRVPTASAQFAMAHRGEVNGTLSTLSGEEFLAISCHVSPGNSGGPILTEIGLCAGIVTQSGTGEFGSPNDPSGTYKSTYHMAIPPHQVSKFIGEVDTQLRSLEVSQQLKEK